MAKHKYKKTTVRIDHDQTTTHEALIALSKMSEGRLLGVLPSPDEPGYTFGRDLAFGEYEGEGLPDGNGEELSFDLRVVRNGNQVSELQFACKGTGRHFRFRLEGLPDPNIPTKRDGQLKLKNSQLVAMFDFLNRIKVQLPFNTYLLFWAYLRQFANRKRRAKDYRTIMENLELQFKPLLKWDKDRYRLIEERKIHGLVLETRVPIETGRFPKSEDETESERKVFKEAVFKALDRIASEGGKHTQLDVGCVIFEENPEKEVTDAMKYRLRKFKIKWKDLLREYDEQKSVRN